MFKFLWGGADGSAVIGVGNFPENGVGIAGVDATRVTERNIAVDLTVNEENWNSGGRD